MDLLYRDSQPWFDHAGLRPNEILAHCTCVIIEYMCDSRTVLAFRDPSPICCVTSESTCVTVGTVSFQCCITKPCQWPVIQTTVALLQDPTGPALPDMIVRLCVFAFTRDFVFLHSLSPISVSKCLVRVCFCL